MEKQPNRWLILAAAIFINISLEAGYMWSLFQGPLQQAHGWTDNISWAYSISFAMVPISMIFFGPKVDQIGGKKIVFLSGVLFGIGMIATGFITQQSLLYLTYGIITGLGIGTGYGTATSTSVKWFPDKKGLAGGLTAAGFGSGSLILTPIVQPMIESLGIQTTFKLMGSVLLLIIIICSFFMEKAPEQSSTTIISSSTDQTPKVMLKTQKFWLLWLIYTLATTGGMMLIGHAAGIVTEYSLGNAAVIIMLCAAFNTGGRVIWGIVSDKIGRYLTVIAMFITNAFGLILLTFNVQLGAVLGVVGMLAIYFSFGGFLGAFPGITAGNWGTKNSGANYGWMFTAYGISAILGPQIATITGYGAAFIISALMCAIGIGLMALFIKQQPKS